MENEKEYEIIEIKKNIKHLKIQKLIYGMLKGIGPILIASSLSTTVGAMALGNDPIMIGGMISSFLSLGVAAELTHKFETGKFLTPKSGIEDYQNEELSWEEQLEAIEKQLKEFNNMLDEFMEKDVDKWK